MGITGRFEVTATVIQYEDQDGSSSTTAALEILLHSKKHNGNSQGQRFVRTDKEQAALVEKIENILLGKPII